MLDTINIERFRGIRALCLEDLGKVNIFVGTNATGKTSVLEAISMIANPTAVQWLVTLSQWREMPPPSRANDDTLRVFFYDLDVSQPVKFEFTLDGQQNSLLVEGIAGGTVVSTAADTHSAAASPMATEPLTELRGVKLVYRRPGENAVESRLNLIEVGFQAEAGSGVQRLGAFHVHARRASSPGETARLLTSLYETKREGELLELLRRVDPRITRLWPGVRNSGPTVMVDVGLARSLPMNVLGDGFCRVALMVTGLLSGDARLLIVDEIDSGLHHSIMHSVWEGIIGIAGDKQVFCATHNEEMLRATLGAFGEHHDWLRVFRLDRHEDGTLTAQKYTYETYDISDKAGLEIR
ncbi:MAG: ATP/GTP-binding protein [Tepidisphaerales bacterium]